MAQGLGFQCELPALDGAVVEVPRQPRPLSTQTAVLPAVVVEPGETVETAKLFHRVSELQLVRLAVDGQQPGGEVGEHTGGDSPARQVSPGASGSVDRPGDDRLTVIEISPDLLDHLSEFLGVTVSRATVGVPAENTEDAVNRRLVGPTPHPLGVRPGTREKLQPRDHHRLTCAGFTGDDCEACGELRRGFLDDPEIPDLQFSQHDGRNPTEQMIEIPVSGATVSVAARATR